MFLQSRTSTCAGLALVGSLVLLAGCGGGGSDPVPTMPDVDIGDNGNTDDGDGGFDEIVDGPAPEPTLINVTTARSIAIESLELSDTLVYFFSDASSLLLNSTTSPISCATGSVTVTQGPTERSFDLDNCAVGGDAGLVLDGVMTFDGSFGNGFNGTQSFTTLAVTSGTRTATINGTANVASTPGNIAVTNGEFIVNDSQSEVTLSQSSLTIRNAGSAQQSVEMNLTANAPRFGLNGATLVSTGLNSQRVACPQSGNLTVSAVNDGSMVINGAPGENLTYVVDETTETLACSEVATILQPSVEVILTPPPAPGSL